MENDLQERNSVMEGLMNLAFTLLGATSPKGKESVAKEMWNLGQSVQQYTNCLHQMARTVPLVLNEYRSTIINLVELLAQLPGSVAEDVVYAILPTVKAFHSLRDVLIMVLRKALFSRNIETRKMAVSGFLQLLKHLDVKGMAVLSSQSSQFNSSQSNSHSMLTQIDMEASGKSNNEAICLEILGVLRRCFIQQAEVRLRLYEGLHSGVIRNPELSVFVQDMIVGHFNQYYEPDAETLPPLNFSSAVVIKDVTVELKEPLGNLVYAIQQLVTTSSCENRSEKLVNILDSLCARMIKCSLEDFGLNDTTNLLDVLPESQQQQEIVRQVLGVYEALLGYVILSWNKSNSAEKAQKLIGIFKGYSKITEYVRNNSKPGKKLMEMQVELNRKRQMARRKEKDDQ
ncbi:hypothetical protein L9F63_026878 [Diploptera punctata]|uniref:Fanconi anemia group I protein n=1 Tax=Diploptera punctata TaxID=6984 RepID=A0AAD8EPV1_DIPPU|nr:hypothetical protein L9F63_026878 [Diploptera punctata]